MIYKLIPLSNSEIKGLFCALPEKTDIQTDAVLCSKSRHNTREENFLRKGF